MILARFELGTSVVTHVSYHQTSGKPKFWTWFGRFLPVCLVRQFFVHPQPFSWRLGLEKKIKSLTLTYAHPNPQALTPLAKIEVLNNDEVCQRGPAADFSLQWQKIRLSLYHMFQMMISYNSFVWSLNWLWTFFYAYVCSFGFFMDVNLKLNCTPSQFSRTIIWRLAKQ